MCEHINLDVYVHNTTLTACKMGKLSTHSTVVVDRARVVCTACGETVFYDPPPSMPASMIKEKAVNWFLLVMDGPATAKTWLKTLQMTVIRNKKKLAGNLCRSDRFRLETLVKRQEEEIEQVKNLIVLMETK